MRPGNSRAAASAFPSSICARHDAAVLRPFVAQHPREPPRVDVGDGHHVLAPEVIGEIRGLAPVGNEHRQVANDEPRGVDAVGFHVFGIRTRISDVRIRERHDLARIRGIREDLLVAGHGGVENHLSDREPVRADRRAAKYRSILEYEDGGRTR